MLDVRLCKPAIYKLKILGRGKFEYYKLIGGGGRGRGNKKEGGTKFLKFSGGGTKGGGHDFWLKFSGGGGETVEETMSGKYFSVI